MLFGLVALAGCSGATGFDCDQSDQCALDGQAGTCEPNGYCSFPDPSCPSGQRYGKYAGAGLAGACVPAEGSTGGSTGQPATTIDSADATTGSTNGSASTTSPLTLDGTSTSSTSAPDTSEGTTTGSATDGSTSSTSAGSSSGSETGSPNVVLSYVAALAECNDPVELDPDLCEGHANPSMGALVVDELDVTLGPFHGYLRFDLDDAIVPADVVAVTLRLVVTDVANSSSSGEVYLVEPFVLMDLFALQPATTGPMLAPDQGPVGPGDVVEWSLPPAMLALDQPSLYLGILPVSTDGVDYWNLDGVQPPELVVEQLP